MYFQILFSYLYVQMTNESVSIGISHIVFLMSKKKRNEGYSSTIKTNRIRHLKEYFWGEQYNFFSFTICLAKKVSKWIWTPV